MWQFFYTSSGKIKDYFSKKIIFQPATQYTPEYFLNPSVSLSPCVKRETVSCLISKFSQWMWSPCWHIHSTWAIADSFECNLHNYTSSSPVEHMPQTPCCSQQNSMRRNSHINACGKKTLNVNVPPPSALYETWWSRWITDMTHNPPICAHTDTHMAPPPLKTYTQREKISLLEKDDLHFNNAFHLLYIFKLICLQYANPIVYHLIPKHKF